MSLHQSVVMTLSARLCCLLHVRIKTWSQCSVKAAINGWKCARRDQSQLGMQIGVNYDAFMLTPVHLSSEFMFGWCESVLYYTRSAWNVGLGRSLNAIWKWSAVVDIQYISMLHVMLNCSTMHFSLQLVFKNLGKVYMAHLIHKKMTWLQTRFF